jgi:hypothetical protein
MAGVLDGKFKFNSGLYPHMWLLTLHLGLALVKRNIAFDLVHAGQRIGIVPRRILDFSLVGRHGVVGRVALVRTMRLGGCRAEMGLGDGVGWELYHCIGQDEGTKGDGCDPRKCYRRQLPICPSRRLRRRLQKRLRGA